MCGRCKTAKPREEFHPSKSKKSGLQDYCKNCQHKLTTNYAKEHPERSKQLNDEYRQRNPDKVANWDRNAKVKRRRLLENAKFDEGITLEAVYERDKGICGICKNPVSREDASIDHEHPLSKGGDHTWKNIQIAHLSCNSRKRDKIIPK